MRLVVVVMVGGGGGAGGRGGGVSPRFAADLRGLAGYGSRVCHLGLDSL